MSEFRGEKLFAKFRPNPPASVASIERCQVELGFRLPADYVQFLRSMNGGRGALGEAYISLWRVEQLVEMNARYKLPEHPRESLLLFGSNGASEGFAFDLRATPPLLIAIPFMGLEWNDAILIASNFRGFLETLYEVGIPFSKGRRYGGIAESGS